MKKNKLSKKLRKNRQKIKLTIAPTLSLRLYNLGKMQEAERASSEELKSNPDNSTALYVSGLLSLRQGQLFLASNFFIRAISSKANFAEAHFELGNIYHIRGQRQEAIKCIQKALTINKKYLGAWEKLGRIFFELGNYEEIENCYKRSIEINNLDPILYCNLAYALLNTGSLREAEKSCMKALDLDKNCAPAYKNLGAINSAQGAATEAVSFYQKALAIKPDPHTHSSILFDLNYLPTLSQEEIYSESLRWDKLYAAPSIMAGKSNADSHEKERRLKIGYLSPDFCDHSVAYFFEPVLLSHDREKFKVYCYSNVKKTDDVTRRIKDAADEWYDIWGMDDAKVIELISNNGIDILVDLAGHSMANRLLVFAQHPAPVQVTWLGYPNTTGLKAIAYRITDAIADPPGESDKLHSEKLIRMEKGFLCYQPDTAAPKITPSPYIKKGYITFGSFNNMSKVSTEVIRLWAGILKSITNSRIILKSKVFKNIENRERYVKIFEAAGIDADRIELLNWLPGKKDHLNLYSEIDIGLDTFPYNGTTTTCEALWMGVPVVTLLGRRHSGRVGASIMYHAGFEELVAESQEEYRILAVSLANDIDKLKELRNSQREKLQNSSLLNRKQFTKILESTYKKIRST